LQNVFVFLAGLVVGLVIGTTVGVLFMAAVVAASRRPPS
jgi:hypothetical protein